MKVYSIVLDKEVAKGGLKGFEDNCVIAVRPEKAVSRKWSEVIRQKLDRKASAEAEIDEIRTYFFALSDSAGFRKKVNKSLESVDNYLDEATTFRVIYDSIEDFVMNQCAKLCAEFVADSLGGLLVEGTNLMSCKEDQGRITVDWEKTIVQIKGRCAGGGVVAVSAGYGRTDDGYIVKIGRGGADLMTTTIASALNCESVVFCNRTGSLQEIPGMTYEEAAHFCSSDDAAFYPAAMWPAVKSGIPIVISNVKTPSIPGTIISAKANEGNSITGIVCDTDLDLITVYGSGLLGTVGISSDLFRTIAENGINIRFISQSSSEYSISFAVKNADCVRAINAISSLIDEKHILTIDDLMIHNKKVAIVSVCGDRMRNVPGISGKVHTALGNAGINIIAAAQGGEELSISIVVDEKDLDKAVKALKTVI